MINFLRIIVIPLATVGGLFAIIYAISHKLIASLTKFEHPRTLAACIGGLLTAAILVGGYLSFGRPYSSDRISPGMIGEFIEESPKGSATLGRSPESPTTLSRSPEGTATLGRSPEGPATLAYSPEDPASLGIVVTASRGFAGPNQYPPEEFAAYGILAFRSRASSFDRHRHLMICEAYVVNLAHWSELPAVPMDEQMVTIWPVDSDPVAYRLNRAPRDTQSLCETAINNYGLVAAQQALKDADLSGVDTSDSGPFLLAWAPSTDKGKEDTLVLVSNLSDVTTYDQARDLIQGWVADIQKNPKLWQAEDGWNLEMVRTTIRLWADKYGPKALTLPGGDK